ncbi:MAG: hypothetical protein AAFV19_03045 [Pseudomonadota bacterium]
MKFTRKEAPLGRTRLIFVCFEVLAVWLIYYLFNLFTTTDPPLWAAAAVLILVDKVTEVTRAWFGSA